MLKFLGSVERVIIAALIVTILALTYSANNLRKKSIADGQALENLELALDKAAQTNKYLGQSVKLSEQSNAKLLKERKSLAAINAQHSDELALLNSQINIAQENIQKLRSSNDSTIKVWANHCVPDYAISLLKYAEPQSCNRNNSTNTVQVPTAASGVLPGVRSGKIKF